MTAETAEQAAWDAYDRKDFQKAARAWEDLIASAASETARDELRTNYCYALVALKRFGEARRICQELLEKTGSHIDLHQLGMVEREAGEYERALALFEQEHSMLQDGDFLAQAANLYERGFVRNLLGRREEALPLAEDCLALSRRTDNPAMRGCAWRLLGDLHRSANPKLAQDHYMQARAAFVEANDAVACAEIDSRMRLLT
ncbi:MAG: tetratricopeptide repeat protein [Verrucomicrobia bacterium]|nr:tetratricopeptide repeat protein [Verrucomicrobiota bacterium]